MEPSILEYPYPKEATRFVLHLLLGRDTYVPSLDGVQVREAQQGPDWSPPSAPPPALDARTEKKVRKAIRRFDPPKSDS